MFWRAISLAQRDQLGNHWPWSIHFLLCSMLPLSHSFFAQILERTRLCFPFCSFASNTNELDGALIRMILVFYQEMIMECFIRVVVDAQVQFWIHVIGGKKLHIASSILFIKFIDNIMRPLTDDELKVRALPLLKLQVHYSSFCSERLRKDQQIVSWYMISIESVRSQSYSQLVLVPTCNFWSLGPMRDIAFVCIMILYTIAASDWCGKQQILVPSNYWVLELVLVNLPKAKSFIWELHFWTIWHNTRRYTFTSITWHVCWCVLL